jgi:hypothetical protein
MHNVRTDAGWMHGCVSLPSWVVLSVSISFLYDFSDCISLVNASAILQCQVLAATWVFNFKER